MILGVILLIIILLLIFRDTIFKLIKGDTLNFLNSKKVITKEVKINNCGIKNFFIDVLDTEVKILYDKDINEISIKTMYLIEEFSYDVNYNKDSVSIIKNDMDNYKGIGNSGRILIRIPKKDIIEGLNMTVINGDIEIYDVDIINALINSHNGIIKIDSLNGDYIDIVKGNGDVSLSHINIKNLSLNIKEGNGDFVDVYADKINVNILSGDFDFANGCESNDRIEVLNINVLNGKQNVNINSNILFE